MLKKDSASFFSSQIQNVLNPFHIRKYMQLRQPDPHIFGYKSPCTPIFAKLHLTLKTFCGLPHCGTMKPTR